MLLKEEEVIMHILTELRIDKMSLEVMARGENPNNPGTIIGAVGDPPRLFWWPVYNLSQKTAKEILDINPNRIFLPF